VLVLNPDGRKEELFVGKAGLQAFIQQSVTNRQSIEKIEPRRKDMEAFFLEIVA
jgi:ABC-2 type transport system ATP-binding protein